MPRLNDYAVICLIPDTEDDLNSCVLVKAANPKTAVRRAADVLWTSHGSRYWDSRKDCKREHDTDIWVTGVIAGENLHLIQWEV
jgi:hypothetical protein